MLHSKAANPDTKAWPRSAQSGPSIDLDSTREEKQDRRLCLEGSSMHRVHVSVKLRVRTVDMDGFWKRGNQISSRKRKEKTQ